MIEQKPSTPIPQTLVIHSLYLLGVFITLIAVGVLLGQTLFAFIATVTGVTVTVGAIMWLLLGVFTLLLGIYRSRTELSDE